MAVEGTGGHTLSYSHRESAEDGRKEIRMFAFTIEHSSLRILSTWFLNAFVGFSQL